MPRLLFVPVAIQLSRAVVPVFSLENVFQFFMISNAHTDTHIHTPIVAHRFIAA